MLVVMSECIKPPTLVSLFTGAGGLDLGLEIAGFQTLAANEIQHHACETLKANQMIPKLNQSEFDSWFNNQLTQRCYKSISSEETEALRIRISAGRKNNLHLQQATILEGDIREVASSELLSHIKLKIGELDLVAGGPPCQPFSRAGNQETVDCETGRLFKEFVRIVDDLKPRWFLFENVKGLIISKTDVLDIRCKSCFTSFIAPFSLRQNPEKLDGKAKCPKCGKSDTEFAFRTVSGGSLEIILNEFSSIGYHCHWTVLNAADFGAPQIRERLFIVGSRDNERYSWPIPTYGKEVTPETPQLSLFSDMAENRKPWHTMHDFLWKKGHWKYGTLDKKKAVLWVKNVVRPHDEPVTWDICRPSPTIGAHQSAKLAVAPEGVPQAQLERQQWHVLGKRQSDTPPVDVEHEYLTDLELLTLQTFPSYWYLFGTRMERAFQIGNAVPLVLAEAVGCSILRNK